MKSILSLLSIVWSITIATAAITPVTLTTEDYTVRIDLEELSKHGANVSIFDERGIQIFSTEIKENTVAKAFNFSKLNEGDYTMRIENDSKIVEQNISISGREVSVEDDVTETFKPFVSTKDDNINVNLLALRHSAAIKMFNNDGEEIYSERINDALSISKSYSTKELPAGDYEVVIYVNGKGFNFPYTK